MSTHKNITKLGKAIFTFLLGTFVIFNLSFTVQAADFKASSLPKPENLPGPVFQPAQNDQNAATTTNRTILTDKVLPNIAIAIVGFVGIASLLMIVIGGLRYAMVFADEEGAEKAKKQIMFAIVGFLIALFSYTLIRIVVNLNLGGVDKTDRTTTTQSPPPASPPPPTP